MTTVNNSAHCMPGNTQSKDTIIGDKDYLYLIEAHLCGILKVYSLLKGELQSI